MASSARVHLGAIRSLFQLMGRDAAYWYRRGRGCLWAKAGYRFRGMCTSRGRPRRSDRSRAGPRSGSPLTSLAGQPTPASARRCLQVATPEVFELEEIAEQSACAPKKCQTSVEFDTLDSYSVPALASFTHRLRHSCVRHHYLLSWRI
jgi:hypothetical protein